MDKAEEATELLVNYYLENRQDGETFAQFAHRVGVDALKAVIMGLGVGV